MNQKEYVLPERALFSLGATKRIINADETKHDLAMLKGAALLFPKVVLNTLMRPFEDICDLVSTGLTSKQTTEVHKILQPIPEDVAARAFSLNDILNEIVSTYDTNEQEISRRVMILESRAERHPAREPLSGEDVFDDPDPLLILFLPKHLKLPYYDSITTKMRVTELLHEIEFNVGKDQELHTGVPNLEELSWESVLDLRQSPFIDGFREFMFTCVGDSQDFAEKHRQGNLEVFKLVKPNRSGQRLKRCLANAPIPWVPLPNPYAVYRDYKDYQKERLLFEKYGWLFFFQEAQAAD